MKSREVFFTKDHLFRFLYAPPAPSTSLTFAGPTRSVPPVLHRVYMAPAFVPHHLFPPRPLPSTGHRCRRQAHPRASLAPIPDKTTPVVPPFIQNLEDAPIIDNAYDRFMIWGLRTLFQRETGIVSNISGYGGLVEECQMLLASSDAETQRHVVERLLAKAVFYPVGSALFRKLFSNNPALNANFTSFVFSWLIGKSERKSRVDGEVYIPKCRFLQQAKCKALCVNMCQQPVQNLFTNTLGLPLRMTPNFEDNSCQMSFGCRPLERKDDPALNSGCLKNCSLSKQFAADHSNHNFNASKGEEECTVQPTTSDV